VKTFQYKGYRLSGEGCSGILEALDLKDAREKLRRQGILAERVASPQQRKWRVGPFRRRAPFDRDARALTYREVGALLGSGLTMTQALDILIEAPEMSSLHGTLAVIREKLSEGVPPANAVHEAGDGVSRFEQAMLGVGEQTGDLGRALDDLAGFLEEETALRESVQTALIYPALVMALAAGIGVITLGVMVPGLARLLTESGMALPPVTRFVLGLSRALTVLGVPLVAALGVGGAWLRRKWRSDDAFRVRVDRWLFRLPVYGRGYEALVNLRFARTLALLLTGGVPLPEGLLSAGGATGSPLVMRRIEEDGRKLSQGQSLADVVRAVGPLAGSLPGWIQAGEAGGMLPELLSGAARRYQARWERFVTRSLLFLEPVLILVVGLFVLLIALALLMPILSLNQTLV
jgi:general secretion pathway protein F